MEKFYRHRLPRRRPDAERGRARRDASRRSSTTAATPRAVPRRSRPASANLDPPPRDHPRVRPQRRRRGQPLPGRHRRGDRADPRDRARERRLRGRGERGVVKGGEGAAALAEAVVAATEQPSNFAPVYPLDDSIERKIEAIATRVYGARRDPPSAGRAQEDRASSSASASTSSRSAWRRRISPSRTTRRSRTRRPASPSRCGTSARTPGPAGSSRSAATCRRCRARQDAGRGQRRHRRRGKDRWALLSARRPGVVPRRLEGLRRALRRRRSRAATSTSRAPS